MRAAHFPLVDRGRSTCCECGNRRLLRHMRFFSGQGYLCKSCIRRQENEQAPFKRWMYMIFPLMGERIEASSPKFGGWTVKGTAFGYAADRIRIDNTTPSLIGGFRVLFSDIDRVAGFNVKGIERNEALWNWYNHVRPYKGAKVTAFFSDSANTPDEGTIEAYYGRFILVRMPWGDAMYGYREIITFDGKRVADILLNEESL